MRIHHLKLSVIFIFFCLGLVLLHNFRTKKSSFDNTTDIISKLNNIQLQELLVSEGPQTISIFLYNKDYSKRYLLVSQEEILNPQADVQTDAFYKILYRYHKNNICNIHKTVSLPQNSSLYKALYSKDLVSNNSFYMSCPIYIDTILIGYVSSVVTPQTSGLVSPSILVLKLLASEISTKINNYL